MNNLNSILIEGNMVREPLYRTTPKGTPVCTFSLASNRFFKQDTGLEKEVSFFEIETWAKLAESCNHQGRKGRGIRVVGRLKQDRWTGNNGKPHSRIRIVAEHIEFRPEFKRDSAMEKHVNAVSKSTATSPDNAGNELDTAEHRYLEEEQAESYEDSQLMANVPASVMF